MNWTPCLSVAASILSRSKLREIFKRSPEKSTLSVWPKTKLSGISGLAWRCPKSLILWKWQNFCKGSMMWTDTTRIEHARKEQRLPSDLTDREWEVLEWLTARASKRLCKGLCRSTAPLGCRAHLCIAEPKPTRRKIKISNDVIIVQTIGLE